MGQAGRGLKEAQRMGFSGPLSPTRIPSATWQQRKISHTD